MKKSKSVFMTIAIIIFTISLVGCTNSNNKSKNVFTLIDIENVDFSSMYKICDTDIDIISFFPVVTNLPITKVEAGCVATSLIANKNINAESTPIVKLIQTEQSNLNRKYKGYYISFVKFCVKIENTAGLKQYESLELKDTKIWLYHNEEFQTAEFNDQYMEIKIVHDVSEVEVMNWSTKLSNIQHTIENTLSQVT